MPDPFDHALDLKVAQAASGVERRLCMMVPIDQRGTAVPALWVSPYTIMQGDTRGRQCVLLSNPGPPKPEIITSFLPENLFKRLPSKPIEFGPHGPKPTADTMPTADVKLYLVDSTFEDSQTTPFTKKDNHPDHYNCRLVHLDELKRDVPILWVSPYIIEDEDLGPSRFAIMMLHPGPGSNIAVNGSTISIQFFQPKTISSPVPYGPKGPRMVEGDLPIV